MRKHTPEIFDKSIVYMNLIGEFVQVDTIVFFDLSWNLLVSINCLFKFLSFLLIFFFKLLLKLLEFFFFKMFFIIISI